MTNRAGVPLPGLTNVRRRKLLSQVELASRAGVGKNTVVRLENGAAAHYRTVRKLAEVLDVDPAELTTPTDSGRPKAAPNGTVPAPGGLVEQADAAFEAGLARLMASLRSEHPDYFDESGALRRDAVLRALGRRAHGRQTLTKSEILALTGRGGAPLPDAP